MIVMFHVHVSRPGYLLLEVRLVSATSMIRTYPPISLIRRSSYELFTASHIIWDDKYVRKLPDFFACFAEVVRAARAIAVDET